MSSSTLLLPTWLPLTFQSISACSNILVHAETMKDILYHVIEFSSAATTGGSKHAQHCIRAECVW